MDDQNQQGQRIESVDDVINNMNGPQTREQLIQTSSGAPEHVRAQIERLPEGEYYRPQDVQNAFRTGTGPQDSPSEEAA